MSTSTLSMFSVPTLRESNSPSQSISPLQLFPTCRPPAGSWWIRPSIWIASLAWPTKIAWFVALGLTLVACTGNPEPLTLQTSPTVSAAPTTTVSPQVETTTTTAETTTTTPGTLSLLNGTPVQDPTLLNRHVLAVKMDNHPKATPQSGVEFADAVIELRVEGITRFITLWHESDADYLGPMRSGRPTDAHLLPAFNEPTFAISGAQAWVQGLIRKPGHPSHR